ncbi:uncharacterized protein B0H18DRAFT_958965 [Fomitopsis serialis]|uniref:uncharacterized protein n=1 Tax=Fomitopsis serialis TaxID=139415 RepID=UPI002007A429|nr:uncharacterized protein B0H18DRAFT_958965 [Neoantrodia serialis]KAH9916133.1 hypothetical protein B0H18DRAFT_958965 [Neoantrodia serialis]
MTHNLLATLPPRDGLPGVSMPFHVAFYAKIPDFRESVVSLSQRVCVGGRPSTCLDEEWDGVEQPATLLLIRLPSGHYAVAVGFFSSTGDSRHRVTLLDGEVNVESIERRLLIRWTTPLGWYRVRLHDKVQFWDVMTGFARVKMEAAQSNDLIKTEIFTLEEYLCNLADRALFEQFERHSTEGVTPKPVSILAWFAFFLGLLMGIVGLVVVYGVQQ